MVVGLDYSNPSIYPYEEFQRLKNHPTIKKFIQNGRCISYGARSLNEGGYQIFFIFRYFAIPKLTFPGGMLAGCSAGFLNAMKIKGSHNAMKSGMLAAEAIYEQLEESAGKELHTYEEKIKKSWVFKELKTTRNFKGAYKFNMYTGLLYGGIHKFLNVIIIINK